MFTNFLRGCFLVYHLFFSPALRTLFGVQGGCRFEPTCSHYAYGSLIQHGLRQGLWLSLKRVIRCHPFGRGGHDPIPHAIPQNSPQPKKEAFLWIARLS